jgi:hypothetical protein
MLESARSWLDLVLTPPSTCDDSWQPFLVSLSPAAAALLSAIALWVASQARTTSRDAQQTSQATASLSLLDAEPPWISALVDAVRDPKRSWSTTAGPASTSTSPGDQGPEVAPSGAADS